MRNTSQNNDHMQETVRRLVANLIGDRPRTHEMAEHRITSDDLSHMPFEARILEIIENCERQSRPIAPTYDRIKDVLIANDQLNYVSMLGDPDSGTGLIGHKTQDNDVYGLAYTIKRVYLQKMANRKIVERITELASSPEGMPEEHLMQMLDVITAQASGITSTRSYTIQEAMEMWLDNQRERVHKRNHGIAIGPDWPFPLLNEYVPSLKKGEMVCIQGKTKYGKSTLGSILAEHWGFTQSIMQSQKYRVLVLLFETSVISTMDRMIARNCLIPTKDLRRGKYDPDDFEDFPLARERMIRFLDGKVNNNEAGFIRIEECPGWGPSEIEAAVDAELRSAQIHDQELIVIVDYYQQINMKSFEGLGPNLYNAAADWLKTLAERKQVYMVVLAQEKDDSRDPKDGTNIHTRSQVIMRIHRVKANEDLRLGSPDGNGVARDSMDNERWLHKQGGVHSDAWIQIMRANDDEPGEVKLRTEMSLFRMYQNDNQQFPPEVPDYTPGN